MADLILKRHGAVANGLISQDSANEWRASLLVRDFDKETEQTRGPEIFTSEASARTWVIRQAAHHGFKESEFDIEVEKLDE